MSKGRSIHEVVKRATVAVAVFHPQKVPDCPYTILGSGFCIDQNGIIITCKHVLEAFMDQESLNRLTQMISGQKDGFSEINSVIPYVIFYSPDVSESNIRVFPIRIENAVAKTNFDLAVLKILPHKAFSEGYPTLPISPYEDIHEAMDIGTCGFPLGNVLQKEIGTVTSSFTKGIISSIIPAAGVSQDEVQRFQLDLTAINGNSGGPVFCSSTGKVFGVLQGGYVEPKSKQRLFTLAEPVYPAFEHDLINRLLKKEMPQMPPA